MPAIIYIAAVAALVIALVAMAFFAFVMPYMGSGAKAQPAQAISATAIPDRVAAEGSLRFDSWQLEPSHRAPTVPYTVEQAHKAMQQHLECGADICGAKRSAMYTLEDAKRVRFDERAVR
jgi:hypothetical protein